MIGEAPARTPLTAREGLFAGVGEANHRTGGFEEVDFPLWGLGYDILPAGD
jgi:hypothetical protein